jgi:phospholipid/cholesterol/gamma-HCH transport system substrate-binding protein
MKESTISTIVGATTLAGLIGLAYLLTAVGGLSKAFESGYRVTIELPTAGGLHENSRVIYNGIDVGRIESVRFQDPPKVGVVAVALITNQQVQLPDDVKVTARFPSLLGGSAVADIGRETGPVTGHLPTDNSAVIMGEPAVDFSLIAEELRNALGGPMQEFQRISDNFDALSKEWKLVGENINQLVEMRSTNAVDDGEAIGNLATVLARADTRLVELRQAIDGINQYVNDEELRDDVRTAAANARSVSQRANDSLDTLRTRYVAVADDLSAAVQSMQMLADTTLEGGGTFGKMVSDPALYENLNDASERLKAAIDDVRLLVEKWKAEGLPVQF